MTQILPHVITRSPRAAIYARYSSDNQSDASIDDQVRVCQARADREGWAAVAVYADYAISGASAHRPQGDDVRAVFEGSGAEDPPRNGGARARRP